MKSPTLTTVEAFQPFISRGLLYVLLSIYNNTFLTGDTSKYKENLVELFHNHKIRNKYHAKKATKQRKRRGNELLINLGQLYFRPIALQKGDRKKGKII